jgi:hypothetical protein
MQCHREGIINCKCNASVFLPGCGRSVGCIAATTLGRCLSLYRISAFLLMMLLLLEIKVVTRVVLIRLKILTCDRIVASHRYQNKSGANHGRNHNVCFVVMHHCRHRWSFCVRLGCWLMTGGGLWCFSLKTTIGFLLRQTQLGSRIRPRMSRIKMSTGHSLKYVRPIM